MTIIKQSYFPDRLALKALVSNKLSLPFLKLSHQANFL